MANNDQSLEVALELNKKNSVKKIEKKHKVSAEKYLNEIKFFENDRVEQSKAMTKIAFIVAAVMAVITLLAISALAVMSPLKETIPYLLRVDNATGHTDILRPMEDAKSTTYGEVLDRYWLKIFITARNGYEWESVQNNFNIVKLMANANVFTAYTLYVTGEESPVNIFSDKKIIEISDQQVTFLPKISKESNIAQIRFTRKVKTIGGLPATGYEPTLWTATVTFDYKAEIKTAEDRDLNPLAFRITSYREDRVSN